MTIYEIASRAPSIAHGSRQGSMVPESSHSTNICCSKIRNTNSRLAVGTVKNILKNYRESDGELNLLQIGLAALIDPL